MQDSDPFPQNLPRSARFLYPGISIQPWYRYAAAVMVTSSSPNVREIALRSLQRLEEGQGLLSSELRSATEHKNLNERDLSFLFRLLKGVTEWRGSIDALLNQKIPKGVQSLPAWIRAILRLGVYQILFLDRVPNSAAVNESVRLAKKYGHPGTVKLVNAVLRRVASDGISVLESISAPEVEERIALQQSHPKWLVSRWLKRFGEEETIQLCSRNNLQWPLHIRLNTLKGDPDTLRLALESEGVQIHNARYSKSSLIIEDLPKGSSLQKLSSFQSGFFMVQDESSSLISILLDPQPGEFIVDLCSAPGGKATHMAELMKDRGRILAVDPIAARLKLVEENCTRLGISIVETVQSDGQILRLEQLADRVLVDVPCSGLGTVGRKKDVRWNRSESDIEELSLLQGTILSHAATLVRPGGILVYSTCSIEPEENEDAVKRFLAEHPDYGVDPPNGSFPKSLLTAEGFFLSLPHRDEIGGAFACRMRRSR